MAILCGQGTRVNHAAAGRCLLPRYCNCWSCGDCAPKKKKRVMAEIAGGEPNIFLTITWKVRPGWTPVEAARALSDAWAKYAALYNRRHGPGSLQYCVVREPTEAGWPHMHIAVRARWIPKRELSAFLEAEIQSPIIKLISLDGVHRIAAYLAKYMTKGPHQFGTLKRYWRTLGYLLPAFHDEQASRRRSGTWGTDDRHWREIAWDAVLRNFRVDTYAAGAFIYARAPP